MSRFIITKDFWKSFPHAQIGVILAHDIDNTKESNLQFEEEIKVGLKKAEQGAIGYLTEDVFSENSIIQIWRQAFRKFKKKKSAKSSIEALMRRVYKKESIPSINPLVDLYNTVSLTYGLPCGGQDMDFFEGNLKLTLAKGGEPFLPIGDQNQDDALPGEMIYKDDAGAVCRCLNWRDGQRTMLRESTTNAFLVMESLQVERIGDLKGALEMLAELIQHYLGGKCEIYLLNCEQPEVKL